MKIHVTSGKGSGSTKLSSFDKALHDANICNYNLIYLSSVIPPDSTVVARKPRIKSNEHGHKLVCVMARKTEHNPEREAWAGIGWSQAEDGKGIFVEHEGSSKQEVGELIDKTIGDMIKYRKGKYGSIKKVIKGIKCRNKPVTVVVSAVYHSEDWNNHK